MTNILGSLAAAPREVQRAAVVRAVRHERLSRSDLISRLQISSSSVTRLVRSLIDDGILTEVGACSSPTVGRPPVQLELVADYGHIVAVSCESTRVRIGIYDQCGAEVLVRVSVLGGQQLDVSVIKNMLDAAWDSAGLAGSRMLGIAVAVPGVVDSLSGAVSEAPDLGWHAPVPLREELESAYEVPVTVDNDVNLLVIAERNIGLAAGINDVVYLYLGHRGLGAGIISGGRLTQGGHGAAGEVGIIPLRADSPAGGSTRIENKVSVAAIAAALEQCGLKSGPSPVALLVDFTAQGNTDAQTIHAEVLSALTQSILILSAILDPSVVLLGGAATELGATELDKITARLVAQTPAPPALMFAQLGSDALILAAQAQCWRRILSGGI